MLDSAESVPLAAHAPNTSPVYNPIFEKLVPKGGGGDEINSLVAYGLYKKAKREWVSQIWDAEKRPPTEAELRAYVAHWTPFLLENLKAQADNYLASFSSSVIDAAEPQIREDALRGTTWSAVKASIVGNAAYTLVLIAFVLILAWAGVDVLGFLEKLKPK